ncbi:MAG TPA: hypothetical protein ENN80_00940 [Candidatus Hydrogenedentes bacterium]|nr:hypothetical protein [Candidatus Hydrogenedentota bacterium]
MAKKSRIDLQRPDQFRDFDEELAEAINFLDETNQRIEGLLQEYALPEAEEAPQCNEGACEDFPAE